MWASEIEPFPIRVTNLDKLPNWEVASEGEPMEEDGMKFRFLEYVNTKLAG